VNTALALIVESDDLAIFEQYRADIERVKAQPLMPITDDAQLAKVAEFLAQVKDLAKRADAARKAMVEDLNDQVRTINGAWKPLTDALASLVERIGGPRGIQTAYMVAKRQREEAEAREAERRRQEALREQEEALRTAEAARTLKGKEAAMAKAREAAATVQDLAIAAQAPVRGIETDSGRTSLVERWAWEVVDESAVPRQFLSVDPKKVDFAISANQPDLAGGRYSIPGVRIYKVPSLRTGRARG
jgi:hypothetical protein